MSPSPPRHHPGRVRARRLAAAGGAGDDVYVLSDDYDLVWEVTGEGTDPQPEDALKNVYA